MSRWVQSLEQLAGEVLPEPVHRYFRQGAGDCVSTDEATAAWGRYRFLPHVLRDVTAVDTATSVLGTTIGSPFAIAPTTLQRAAHVGGEIAMARAVASMGSLMVVSSNAGSTFAAIAETGVEWWLQAYLCANRTTCKPLLDAAVLAGAKAIVLTVDTPIVGTKHDDAAGSVWDSVDPRWLRVNFPDGYGSSPGDEKATDLGAHDIAWLREMTGLPVVVKGVLRGDDARRCVDAGASAIWVSNHGGRQLDYSVTTADALGAIVEEVGVDAEVYVDGGVRNGRHGLAALALGARGVFLGRPPLYALAIDGSDGVSRLLTGLNEELGESMRLSGVSRAADLPANLLAGGC